MDASALDNVPGVSSLTNATPPASISLIRSMLVAISALGIVTALHIDNCAAVVG
jgi:hypothetical protein